MTTYLALWAAIGPLSGITLGHFLTRSSQHKQWLRDTRKQEFKELVSAMSKTMIESARSSQSPWLASSHPEAYLDLLAIALTCAVDRIYIDADLSKLNVANRFMALSKQLADGANVEDTSAKMHILIDEIKASARKG